VETLAIVGFIAVGLALAAVATYIRAKLAFRAARDARHRTRGSQESEHG
jgi:hypothetical protein